jgi:signal transduction histidine kinase
MASRPHPILWFRRHPRVADALLAVVVAGLAISVILTNKPDDTLSGLRIPRSADVLAVGLVTVGALSLIWRRVKPLPVLVVSLAMLILRERLNYPDGGDSLAPIIAAYTVAVTTDVRRRLAWIASSVLAVVTFFTLFDLGTITTGNVVGSLVTNVIVFGTAFLLGDNMRQRRQRLVDLQQRNAFLEREQGLLADRAVVAERTRIARELHDVVAHSVSVMAIQAGGARRVVHTKPDLAVEALATIETTARQTLDELRDLLGVLRTADPTPENAPQPGISDLETLVHADPKLAVTLTVNGEQTSIPAMVDLSAYRIVQEALTNVRKHAGLTSAAVAVAIRYLPDSVEVEVVDDGRGAAANQSGGGHGLTGMRERAALCGGRLDAGPRQGGGWFVRATLPVAPCSA